MHILTAKQRNALVEIASRSTFGRHSTCNLRGKIFDSFDQPILVGKCGVKCLLAKLVEGFELAAFGGQCGVNRRATGIQVRRDTLLLRQQRERDTRLPKGSFGLMRRCELVTRSLKARHVFSKDG